MARRGGRNAPAARGDPRQHAGPAGEKIAQEIALLATKSDVREELDRLHAHIEAARALLAEATNPTVTIEVWWEEIEALLAAAAHLRALLATDDEVAPIEFWREEVEALLAGADRVLAESRN